MTAHHFDALSEWSQCSDVDLAAKFGPEAELLMRKITQDLTDQSLQTAITQDNFVTLVRRMRALYENGSRSLGDVIASAGELRDKGQPEEARALLLAFAQECSSPFYRKIARNYADRGASAE